MPQMLKMPALILDTIEGSTYYDYNGILCSTVIDGILTRYEQSVFVEKNHHAENKCKEDLVKNLVNNHPKIFSKYEQK